MKFFKLSLGAFWRRLLRCGVARELADQAAAAKEAEEGEEVERVGLCFEQETVDVEQPSWALVAV